MNGANAPRGDELGESGDEVRCIPEGGVVLEVGVVGGVVDNAASGTVVGDLL